MIAEDADKEIEKLKLKKVELTNKINMTTDFDEKDRFERELAKIGEQIRLLEKLKGK